MKKELFDELLQSVKQGGAIMKRIMRPARAFTFAESEVKKNLIKFSPECKGDRQ
jgi:hypothetical protein